MALVQDSIIRLGTVRGRDAVPDDQPFAAGADLYDIAVFDVTGQQHFGQRVLERALNDAF